MWIRTRRKTKLQKKRKKENKNLEEEEEEEDEKANRGQKHIQKTNRRTNRIPDAMLVCITYATCLIVIVYNKFTHSNLLSRAITQ